MGNEIILLVFKIAIRLQALSSFSRPEELFSAAMQKFWHDSRKTLDTRQEKVLTQLL